MFLDGIKEGRHRQHDDEKKAQGDSGKGKERASSSENELEALKHEHKLMQEEITCIRTRNAELKSELKGMQVSACQLEQELMQWNVGILYNDPMGFIEEPLAPQGSASQSMPLSYAGVAALPPVPREPVYPLTATYQAAVQVAK